MNSNEERFERKIGPEVQQELVRIIEARDLFQGRREVWVEHEGVRYRLRITRRNKLILQK